MSLLKYALRPENSMKGAKKEDLSPLTLESRCTNPECKIRALTMHQDMTYTYVLVAVTPEADPLSRSFIVAQPVAQFTFRLWNPFISCSSLHILCQCSSLHILCQMNSVHILPSFLSNTHFSIFLLSTSTSSK